MQTNEIKRGEKRTPDLLPFRQNLASHVPHMLLPHLLDLPLLIQSAAEHILAYELATSQLFWQQLPKKQINE